MEKTIHLSQIPNLIKNNWFKILIGSLLLVLFLRKDVSFQVNMQSPDQKDAPAKNTPKTPAKTKDVFTEKKETASIRQKLGLLPMSSPEKSIDLQTELSRVEKDIKVAYLKRFAHVAIAERKKFGVPSSIILANALLNSTAGNRAIASQSSNHFGIACEGTWSGSTATHDGLCYRKYENAWASFRNHSEYLTSGRFAHLKELSTEDYKGWARGLEKAGFSEDANYDKKIIQIIEAYSLEQLDKK